VIYGTKTLQIFYYTPSTGSDSATFMEWKFVADEKYHYDFNTMHKNLNLYITVQAQTSKTFTTITFMSANIQNLMWLRIPLYQWEQDVCQNKYTMTAEIIPYWYD
jgi:hypothetical protein